MREASFSRPCAKNFAVPESKGQKNKGQETREQPNHGGMMVEGADADYE
jgi:hypothetical protein